MERKERLIERERATNVTRQKDGWRRTMIDRKHLSVSLQLWGKHKPHFMPRRDMKNIALGVQAANKWIIKGPCAKFLICLWSSFVTPSLLFWNTVSSHLSVSFLGLFFGDPLSTMISFTAWLYRSVFIFLIESRHLFILQRRSTGKLCWSFVKDWQTGRSQDWRPDTVSCNRRWGFI